MKIIKYLVVLLILISSPVFAEDLYYAQSQAGTHSGDSCANAIALSAISWGSGTGNVSAGDTVHLCGTLTSTLTIGGSGSSGSPITILFETGAKLSKGAWGIGSSAAIYSSGRSYIVIDGGTNGIIEDTANGTGLANQQASSGIQTDSTTNIEIKNLTVRNLYVRTSDTDSHDLGNGIYLWGNVSGTSIHHNTIHNMSCPIDTVITENSTNINIYNNTIYASAWSLAVATWSGPTVSNVNIYNNTITNSTNWYDSGDSIHSDGIYVYGSVGSGLISNVKIYNNSLTGAMTSHQTALIFIAYDVYPTYIYNNILSSTGSGPTNAYIDISYNSTAGGYHYIHNNTIVGLGNAIYTADATKYIDIKNNIFDVDGAIILENGTNNMITSDYNSYYNMAGIHHQGSYYDYATIASWRTYLGGCPGSNNDCNTITTNPNLNTDYTPKVTSPVTGAGTATGQLSSTDKAGTTWSSPPSIGAYEYGAGGVVNGACGSADGGTFSSTPTTNLCTTGTATEVTLESTTYSWDCEGSGGGTTDNCTATYEASSDTTAPAVTISTASGSTITSDSKTVAGTATDAVGVSGCKYRIGSDTIDATHGTACTGTTSWSCATSGYASGSNTVYVECYDAVPNYSTGHSITVTYNPPTSTALLSGAVCKGCVVK